MLTKKITLLRSLGLLLFSLPLLVSAQAKLTLQLDKPGVPVSPKLYGLMTEEINYSYDGGLYAELIRNRIFKDNPKAPDHWSLVQDGDAAGKISLTDREPINKALTICLELNANRVGKRIGVANDGFWGIPVRPATTYRGSFYVKTPAKNSAALTVSIESADGKTTYATTQLKTVNDKWQKLTFMLTTDAEVKPTADTRFVISTNTPGDYYFNLVSLFPPTFNNRPNGNRKDIMQLLGDMHPAFLRLPGGNYLEGITFSGRYNWQKTLGPLEDRPGHMGTWSYRSSDGMGLLEYLEWCEDLKMEPVLAVFAGYTLNRDYLDAGPLLKPFVDNALDEIEYVTGDAKTKWGKQRALDGHPKPFKLTYVEVGNEDGFDVSGSYEARYTQFYDAIKARYPHLQVISTVGGKDPLGDRFKITTRKLEMVDEHYYRSAEEMEEDAAHYDNYNRNGFKVFVGEWATREGSPTPNFNAALGDAAWMTGMERNSDIVLMSCYAPLFVNVNKGGMQWSSDLIGFDALNSYGSPSYYAQKIFNTYRGDKVVPVTSENIPLQNKKMSAKDTAAGLKPKAIPTLFYVATRNSKTGTVYLKIVNTSAKGQNVSIDLKGVERVNANGTEVVLKAAKPEDTNSITEPAKILPVKSGINNLGKTFEKMIPPYSINVLEIETK